MEKVERLKSLEIVAIIWGVSGAGETTVGKLLAEEPSWKFYDGFTRRPAVIPFSNEASADPGKETIEITYRYAAGAGGQRQATLDELARSRHFL